MVRASRILTMSLLALCAVSAGAQAADNPPHHRHRTHIVKHGGYSYSSEQTINTAGDTLGRYGSANSLRDPSFGRQTPLGPFDSGFFYDSGAGPGQHGGESIYMH